MGTANTEVNILMYAQNEGGGGGVTLLIMHTVF